MKSLRVVNLILLCALLAAGLTAQPASTRTQTAYDCSTATGLPQTECEALVALYAATGGDDWHNTTGWLQTSTPCAWYGVTCATGHVTQLSLLSNHLNGALPPEIGNLTALRRLYLWDNAVTALPPEIGNLAALEWLDLDTNALTALPVEIGSLGALRSFSWTTTLFPPSRQRSET